MKNRWRTFGVSMAYAMAAMEMTGCFQAAEDRALMDEEVGIADAFGVSVRIAEGLAAVKKAAEGELILWATSPVLEIDMTSIDKAVPAWRITVKNIPADAEMNAWTADGTPLVVTKEKNTDGCAADRTWTVQLIPGTRATLRVFSKEAEQTSRIRFAIVNDPHSADTMRTVIPHINDDATIRMVLSSGDISGGGEPRRLEAFEQALCNLTVPFYSAIGNNDVDSNSPDAWHTVFGRHNYHFNAFGVSFTFIDSASASVAPTVYDWMEDWLDAPETGPRVLLTHIPPLDPLGSRNGGFRSRSEAAKFLNRSAQGKIDLLICGHLHRYYSLREGGIPTLITDAYDEYNINIVEIDPETGAFSTSRVWNPS